MSVCRAYVLAATALLALAACEPGTSGTAKTGGTVLTAGDTEMRVAEGETVSNIAGGPLVMLHVTRADGKTTSGSDEASARAAYTAYCADKGGVGVGGEGYFSQFGDAPAWKFGNCGA
ncbi:hypothetical protein [Paracoccus tegillarcae]|uniref:Lipoprotein n=1 Tax=Paracoccus tegillarcae TaxID=1529068 RepID=A0A2K9ETD4_9RHOB|nr:hypothetical protein [Paracoccus tegillarcae]AUH35025.1 hypothetical protein CUV01_18060 [Paracoccus tegillarcae]